ncbi:hypothetical protein SBP28_003250 [Candidozyma auris]|nr:hypothetical protein CJJ09_003347 [[Candida] auris]
MPRQRNESFSHLNSVAPVPIELTDDTMSASQFDDSSRITDVLVGDYHIVSGDSAPHFSLSRMWFSDSWLESRRRGLQWFMTYVLLNPKYQHSPVITQFVLKQTAR